jgi:hypothetical protein
MPVATIDLVPVGDDGLVDSGSEIVQECLHDERNPPVTIASPAAISVPCAPRGFKDTGPSLKFSFDYNRK